MLVLSVISIIQKLACGLVETFVLFQGAETQRKWLIGSNHICVNLKFVRWRFEFFQIVFKTSAYWALELPCLVQHVIRTRCQRSHHAFAVLNPQL